MIRQEKTHSPLISLFSKSICRGDKGFLREMVEKYKDDTTFVFIINKCFMEAIVPKKNWIPPIGYEVNEEMIEGTTQVLLMSLVDETQEWFGTTAESL